MYSVLFVCTANICRSPMAMGLLRAKVEQEADEWRIESAGVWAQNGQPAAVFTRQVLADRGIELGNFRSRPITRELVESFNLILTMERGQKEALRAAFPQQASKVFLLTEMANRFGDIVDPIGGPLMDYEDTAREIEHLLTKGYERIRELAADAPDVGS